MLLIKHATWSSTTSFPHDTARLSAMRKLSATAAPMSCGRSPSGKVAAVRIMDLTRGRRMFAMLPPLPIDCRISRINAGFKPAVATAVRAALLALIVVVIHVFIASVVVRG